MNGTDFLPSSFFPHFQVMNTLDTFSYKKKGKEKKTWAIFWLPLIVFGKWPVTS